MKIGVVGGTGKFGRELSINLAMVGHDVVIGSRKAEKAIETVADIEKHSNIELSLKGESNKRAVELSDIVFLSIPYDNIFDTLNDVMEKLHQKILITNIVPIDKYWGRFHRKLISGSVAETIEYNIPVDNKVISALHTIPSNYLPHTIKLQTFVYVNEEGWLEMIFELFNSINIEPLYCGNLRQSIFAEELAIFLLNMNILNGIGNKTIQVI